CLFRAVSPTLSGSTARGNASVSGLLLGGNLTVMAAMAGTSFLPDVEGAIVLLEDIGERPYRLDRSLTQLLQAGHFDGAVGFAIGQLTGCSEPGEQDVEIDALGVVIDRLDTGNVPIVTGLLVGHENSSHPLIIGQEVSLDPVRGRLSEMPAS
ncbi:MAG: LD-carboxypeptidase, partial [Myxococcota bacterium]